MSRMGSYIVLEGPDGGGKSTQARALVAWLQEKGRPVLHVREPGSTPTGEALRRLLLDPATGELRPETEALLFTAARAELVQNVIRPALRRGATVIAERCFLSTLVYQGVLHGLDRAWLDGLTAAAHGDCLPHRIFVLDVAPELSAARRAERAADRFEARGQDWLQRVRAAFLAVAEGLPAARVIDAGAAPATVQAALRAALEELA